MTNPTQAQIEAALKAFMESEGSDGEKAMAAALTAAADTGEQERHNAQVERYVTLGEAIRKQTIEHCAQVARNTLVIFDYPVPAERVFEAIMALKDQAPHSFEDNPLDWRRP